MKMKLYIEIDKKFREIKTISTFIKLIYEEKYGKINKPIKQKLKDITNILENNIHESNLYLQNIIHRMNNLTRIKEDFIININHQIRTPLTTLKGTIDFLQECIYDMKKSEILNRLKRLNSSIEILTKLIYELLDTSNFENNSIKTNLTKLNLKEIILNIIEYYKKKYLDKEINIEIYFPKDPIFILNDEYHIRKALSVIIENAFIYTENGTLQIRYDIVNKKNEVEIEIIDSGIGINEIDQKNLFKLFSRGEIYSKNGLGLGLYITYKFIKIHGGKIQVKSKKNEGTTFKIYLPIQSKYKKKKSIKNNN